jgi:hypothetical protein
MNGEWAPNTMFLVNVNDKKIRLEIIYWAR